MDKVFFFHLYFGFINVEQLHKKIDRLVNAVALYIKRKHMFKCGKGLRFLFVFYLYVGLVQCQTIKWRIHRDVNAITDQNENIH